MTPAIAELQEVIRRAHDCECTHLESVPIKETFHGKTVWDGIVEDFALTGHSTASQCFA
jgi:hypothetical protein